MAHDRRDLGLRLILIAALLAMIAIVHFTIVAEGTQFFTRGFVTPEGFASIRDRPRGELGISARLYLPLAATFILAMIALALRGLNLCLRPPVERDRLGRPPGPRRPARASNHRFARIAARTQSKNPTAQAIPNTAVEE